MNIGSLLLQRYPGSGKIEKVRNAIADACNYFVDSGLADSKFTTEICSGSDAKFWSCVSEALLAAHLNYAGIVPSASPRGEGPDFLVIENGRKIWIEVICPEPCGVPEEWLNRKSVGVVNFPHIEILLRWTSAIKAKAEKLIGSIDGTQKGYLNKGIVAPNDAYVIAINGCQLRGPFSRVTGISQFPFAAEAAFAIGPYQIMIDRDTLEQTGAGHQHRPEIIKPNGSSVPAYTFLDPRFQPISAIWAVDIDGTSVIGNLEDLAVIHNPYATNPIPVGFLPAYDEYLATPISLDEMQLNRQDGRLKLHQ
jgi:type I restriction enzyme S subunit